MFFKVVTKDQLAPGKIHFGFADGQYCRTRKNSHVRDTPIEPQTPASPTKPARKVPRVKVELSAYFSVNDKNREPTKELNDKAIENPSGLITMPILGKDRFENEEVYVSLYSITGCTVLLTATFPDLKIQNYTRKHVKEDYADEAEFENYLVVKNWKK